MSVGWVFWMVTDGNTCTSYEFGPFRLDLRERLLLRNGKVVPLAPKLLETLEILVQNNGHLMEKDFLMHKLWPNNFTEESSLTQNIFQLRKALRGATEEEYIETIPKRGYRFVANVREIIDVSTVGQHSLKTPLLEEKTKEEIGVKSVVVLPFRSFGSEVSDEYLGLGMADAIIIKLAEFRELVVMPTSTVSKYSGKKNDPLTIGHELNVDAVIDGTVQRSGFRVRVTVQLISIKNGRAIWSGKFDEAINEIFALQDSISEQVANAFTLKISAPEREQLRRRHTENIDAYQTYLMGLFFWSKATKEALQQAINYFQMAIEKDPEYALAYAGLADSYFLMTDRHYDDLPLEQAYQRIEKAALSSLELDPLLAEAYAALAVVRIKHDRDSVAADNLFMRAIAVNPNCVVAHLRYTWFLAAMGDLDQALQEASKAQALDPLSPATNAALGGILYFARQWEEAISYCQRAIVIEPAFVSALLWKGRCYEHQGMLDEAIAQFRDAIEVAVEDNEPWALLAHALAIAGHRDQAQETLNQVLESTQLQNIRPHSVALVYCGLGQLEPAFEWLEKPYFNWTERLRMLRYDPLLDALRLDPRFEAILKQSVPDGHDPGN